MYAATISAEALKIRSRETYYAKQKQLFVLVIILVSLLPLFVISWSSSHYYRESWLAKTSAELTGLAQGRKEIIDLFLKNQEHLLAGLVAISDREHLRASDNLAGMFAAMNRSGVMVDMGVIDRNGDHLAYVGPFAEELAGRNYAGSQWFQEVMSNGRYISDVFSGYRGVPHFVVAVADPERTWLLRATINSELFNTLLLSADVGEGGDAFLVNRQGELQTPSRFGLATPGPEVFDLLAPDDGQEPVRHIGGALYASTWLKEGDWLLVLKTDVDTSLAGFYRARKRDMAIIAVAALLTLLVATLLVRSMVSKIERADRQRMLLDDRVRQVEKMALVGRMAASVAHEINNPLQIIGDQAGWVEELLAEESAGLKNRDELQQSAARIRGQVKRASVITHRLLGFSRSRGTERTACDVNALVGETVSFLENEARHHNIEIRKNLEQSLPQVVTDGGQLQQVFLNILNNGIDAMGQDGILTITTEQENGRILVRFADTGPGLPEGAAEKIFDPFFTTKQRGKGTGLGLSVSFSIMERLGGGLSAANGKSGGAVFTVSLPGRTPPGTGAGA